MIAFIVGWLALLLGLVAVIYLCDRLHIGQHQHSATPPSPPVTVSPEEEAIARAFISSVMIPAVKASYAECGLAFPRSLPMHLPPDGQSPVVYHPKFGKCVRCTIFREGQIQGPISDLHTRYLPYPLRELVQKLNSTLPNFAISAGYPPCKIIGGKSMDAGRIILIVAFQQEGMV